MKSLFLKVNWLLRGGYRIIFSDYLPWLLKFPIQSVMIVIYKNVCCTLSRLTYVTIVKAETLNCRRPVQADSVYKITKTDVQLQNDAMGRGLI